MDQNINLGDVRITIDIETVASRIINSVLNQMVAKGLFNELQSNAMFDQVKARVIEDLRSGFADGTVSLRPKKQLN